MSEPLRQPLRHGAGTLADPVPIYYESLEPAAGPTRGTIVMVHGGSHSGHGYAATIEGKPGWGPYFARQGYKVVMPDWPGCGRSGFIKAADHGGEAVVAGLSALIRAQDEPVTLLTHSMSGAFGWVLLERLGARIKCVVGVAPAPPGNVQPEGLVLSETDTTLEVEAMGRRQTVSKTGEASRDPDWVSNKLVGNSLFFPKELIPAYGSSLLKMGFRLQYERMNLRGSQLKVADTAKLKGRPVLVITGDRDRDHSREIDGAIVDWLRDCGAAVDFYWLPEHGIEGNGHMMMLETNADQTAAIIQEWIEARG